MIKKNKNKKQVREKGEGNGNVWEREKINKQTKNANNLRAV